MIQYNEVQLLYTSPAFCPENIYMDRMYRIKKNTKGFLFTDGNYEEYADVEYIKMLFTPKNADWKEVSFDDNKIKK